MDELLFRAEQTIDALQIQLQVATDAGLRIARQYSEEARQFASRSFNEAKFDIIKERAIHFWEAVLVIIKKTKDVGSKIMSPDQIIEHIRKLMRDEMCRNNLFFICIGLGFGTAGGILIGVWMTRSKLSAPVMKSIACTSDDTVSLCHTPIPTLINSTDILIRVRAVSINRLDERICEGYGRKLRHLLYGYNRVSNPEYPLVIGRACAGIVEGVGAATKSGLEIGDEVWLAASWFNGGLASEIVVAPEGRVGRKPFIIGFEGAASLPYSGCLALNSLKTAGLNAKNCMGKRILIQDGCSPVGCVLTQLVKKWGAYVTSTCHVRSVPVIRALEYRGADDIIGFYSETEIEDDEPLFEEQNILFKELSIRTEYDFVFFTTRTPYDKEFIRSFVKPKGIVVDTVEQRPSSDDYGVLKTCFYSLYVKVKLLGARFFNYTPDWGGPHLCHLTLDQLAGYVNDGLVQTVVDQVYTPQDADNALAHVCSPKAIGSTIVTFR